MTHKTPTLTPEQKRILLTLCNAWEGDGSGIVRLRVTDGPMPIRETTTGAALARKGLAVKMTYHGKGAYRATPEGFWLGDALRIEERLGRIPPRRTPGE